jgi:biotin-(acetyl-CoA carboxylase) ligase
MTSSPRRDRSSPGFSSNALEGLATSLLLEGASVRRIDLLARLLQELDRGWREPEEALLAHAAEHDALRGAEVGCSTAEGAFEGRVLRADPMRGLVVSAADGSDSRLLPAATTSIVWWRPAGASIIDKRRR